MTIGYRTVFKLQLYHGYFLNSGETLFNSMTDAEKNRLLAQYNYNEYMEVVPFPETKELLQNQRLLIKFSGSQLMIVASVEDGSYTPIIPLSSSEVFNFYLRRKDIHFNQYTDFEFETGKLFLFSNKQPSDIAGTIPLIHLGSSTSLVDDTYKLSLADSEVVAEDLTAAEKSGIIGVVRIYTDAGAASYDLLDGVNTLKTTPPTFKIHFPNTYTYWKYIHEADAFEVETVAEKPLTRNGYVEIDPATDFGISPPPAVFDYTYPNPGLGTIEVDSPKVYSVIFI